MDILVRDGEPKSRPPGSKSTMSFSRNTDLTRKVRIYVTFTVNFDARNRIRHASDYRGKINITNRLNDARAPGLAEFAKSKRHILCRLELIPRYWMDPKVWRHFNGKR